VVISLLDLKARSLPVEVALFIAKPLRLRGFWEEALCRQHGFVLATRDRGFQQVLGLEVIEFTARARDSR